MKNPLAPIRVSRRGFLWSTASGPAVLAAGIPQQPRARSVKGGTVRDRLWMFTVPANTDFASVKRRSVMTPAESAFYFGVPNIIMVQASAGEAAYGRFEPPFAQYTIALRPLQRVAWSVVGSGGFTSPEETSEVLGLAKTTPNFVGIMLDDFFKDGKDGKRAVFTVEELSEIRRKLKETRSDLDIFVTLYTRQLDLPLDDYLSLVDVVTLWTGRLEDLGSLESNLAKAEKAAPKARIMLGCRMFDFGNRKPASVSSAQQVCEPGLRWLRQSRIEGIIFLANTLMDFDFECVEWVRAWIRKVGDTRL